MFSREGFEDSSHWALQRSGGGAVVARWRYGDDGRCRIEFHDFKSTTDRQSRMWGSSVEDVEAWGEMFGQFVAAVAPFAMRQQNPDAPASVHRDVTVCRLISLPADCDPYLLHHGKGRLSHAHFFVDPQDERRILIASATEAYGGMRDAKIVQAEQDDRGRWLQAEVDPDLGESYARFASPWGVEAVNMIDRAASMEMGRWA
jgi:hypothetical protein